MGGNKRRRIGANARFTKNAETIGHGRKDHREEGQKEEKVIDAAYEESSRNGGKGESVKESLQKTI